MKINAEMENQLNEVMDLYVSTLQLTATTFNLIRSSNVKGQDRLKYVINSTNELKDFINKTEPMLNSLLID